MQVAQFNIVVPQVIGRINADSTQSFTIAVDSDLQSVNKVKEAVWEADADVVLADIDNPFHTHGIAPSADLQHGASLAGVVSKPGKVEIKIAALDSVYEGAIKAPLDAIRRWRRNLNGMYGPIAHDAANSPLGARYCIELGSLYFTGTVARVYRANDFTIDRTTPALQSNEIYSPLIVSGAISKLFMEGMISDVMFKTETDLFQKGLDRIRSRAGALLQIYS